MSVRLIVPTSTSVSQDALSAAVRMSAGRGGGIRVVLPMVLPSTLPISAFPPRLEQRLQRQRSAVEAALRGLGRHGRVEVVHGRSIEAIVSAVCRDQLPTEIVLVGGASWLLRRALHRVAPVTVIPGRSGRRRRLLPAARPIPGQ